MNVFQICNNTTDIIPLYLPQQLFLKPIAKIQISIHLPQYKIMGKTVSHLEIREKLKGVIKPEEFTQLKVTKTTREVIQFEAEVDHKNKLSKTIEKLDKKMIKLTEINNLLQVRAVEAKSNFPTKHSWDSYFRDAKDMDEMKPGERPDTIYLSNLPIRWFVMHHLQDENDVKPSEKILYRIFEKFGKIRNVDVPICDPYRQQMKSYMTGILSHSFEDKELFEGYVQFKDYIGFLKAMDELRGMKLVHKSNNNCYTIDITIDFDKCKHLTEASIRRREIVRDRLIEKEQKHRDKEKEAKEAELQRAEKERENDLASKKEKEKRRREREEKRKASVLAKLKMKESDDINEKIAKEEKKLLKVQRKLEAIRLIEELFRRIKEKDESEKSPSSKLRSNEDEIVKFKKSTEMDVVKQREVLHVAIENRVLLKTIIKKNLRNREDTDTDTDSDSRKDYKEDVKKEEDNSNHTIPPNYPINTWYNPFFNGMYPPYHMPPMYSRGGPHHYNSFNYRGNSRGSGIRGHPFNSRGRNNYKTRFGHNRGRGHMSQYPPELQEEYYKYFQKFLNEDRDHNSRSRSYTRSRTRSRSNSRNTRSSPRRKSRSRSSPRRRSRSRSSPRRRSRSRSRSRTKSRSRRSRSRRTDDRSRSYSRSRSRKHNTRSNSRDRRSYSRNRSRPNTPTNKEEESSRSPGNKSADSSEFISPRELKRRNMR